jgi:C-terminal processing protease CtpA/Prc
LILLSSVFTGCVHSQNTYNLDFEELNSRTGMPNGWGMGNIRNADIPNDNTLEAYKVDSVIKQHGKYSLLIDWSKGYKEWTASNYVINRAFKGKKIKLTGFVKTENVTDGAGLWMRLDGKDYKNLGFDNMEDRFIKGTTDWKEYSIELDYDGDEVISIVVGGLIEGKGKMWMDNLHITIDGKGISEATVYTPTLSKPEIDSMYNNGSGINSIVLNKDKIRELTNLGMLWGFIKYYHANVNNGGYNMDAELFLILSKVIAANSIDETNSILDKWVDVFGKPDSCKDCADFKNTKDTKLAPDYGYLFDKNNLPQTLIGKLNYIKRNRSTRKDHYYIEMAKGIGNPVFKHETSYSKNAYPDAGIRLLALYRYWNIVQYFFPDRHLIGEDWNKVLGEFIPEFCNAKETLDFQLACLKLIARIHDTHANVWGGGTAIQKMKGDLITPFQANFIENKLVVVDYYKDTLNIKNIVKPGDIIEKINNVAVDELVNRYLPMVPASNYETQLRDLPGLRGFLLRSNDEKVQLTVNRNGERSVITIQRIALDPMMGKLDFGVKTDSGYKMLKDNIGYLFPAKLTDNDLDKIEAEFDNTKGLIIDMRCYPSTFMTFSYAGWLKPAPSPFVKFTGGSIDFPGFIEYGQELENGRKRRDNYKGKLVIIVNAITQSSAEYQTMALCTTPGAKVIGSTTAGADGNVSEIILPGGIRTMFSGIGIIYPDGTESQRKGVKIDKVVKPTIKGIQEGRDELLEEAIKIIKE